VVPGVVLGCGVPLVDGVVDGLGRGVDVTLGVAVGAALEVGLGVGVGLGPVAPPCDTASASIVTTPVASGASPWLGFDCVYAPALK
jgi:hypothetical protein